MPSVASIIRTAIHDRNIGRACGVTTTFTSAAWALGPLAGGYLAASVGAAIVTWRVRSDGPDIRDFGVKLADEPSRED